MRLNLNRRTTELLVLVPVLAYILSYFYLAIYHGKFNILTTVIHEGGTYTFIETLLYATHFIGHIPVHTVLAIYFVGIYLSFESTTEIRVEWSNVGWLFTGIIVLIFLGLWISFSWFGTEDTISFLLQKKQSVTRYEEGGSWNLHLPSTVMQYLLIPVYIYGVKWLFKTPIKLNSKGINLIVISILLCILMIFLVNSSPINSVINIWKDPRYLAHSVRELATFPITYYPIALYFMMKKSKTTQSGYKPAIKAINVSLLIIFILFTSLFIYQAVIPLSVGIGDLAQKPDFAKEGELSIFYLLTSHYFEHFLESTYFILVSLFLYYLSHYFSVNRNSNFAQ
jgi:hypothetical protein